MQIDNSRQGRMYNYGLYKGLPAYLDMYNKKIIVFKDISPKRVVVREQLYGYLGYKVQYVSNAQLLKMNYMSDIKAVVFDGKLGTRYSTRGSVGPYFFCKKKGEPEPVAKRSG